MSAFICSDKHIAVIVEAYAHHINDQISIDKKTLVRLDTREGKQHLGNLLKNENIRSVNYRYGERTKLNTYSHGDGSLTDIYGTRFANAVEACKLIDSLSYQSCERDDWEFSKAKRILDRMYAEFGSKIIRETHETKKAYDIANWSL
jgi:hypothetical protein